MKYCKKCGLCVRTNDHFCPLCASVLTEPDSIGASPALSEVEISENTCSAPYPAGATGIQYNITIRLLLFLSIVAASVCLLINLLVYQGVLWSLLVVGGIAFCWAALIYPFLVKKNIGHYITVDAVCACLFFIVAQFVTQSKGWSLDYVIPFLFIAATTMITFTILLRRMRWREYALYQLITIILGLLPLISIAASLVIIKWPSVASAFYSYITLLGMIIFANKKYKNELIKRFHF